MARVSSFSTFAVREVHRILKPGERSLVQDGQRLPEPLFVEMNAELVQRGCAPETHPGFHLEDLANLLKCQGFAIERLMMVGCVTFASPPYMHRVYASDAFLLSAQKPFDFMVPREPF